VEVQVRDDGVAGVAYEGEDLAEFDAIAGVDLDAAGLEVGVEGVAVAAEVEDDGVAIGLFDENVGGEFAGDLLWVAVGGGDDDGVGYGDGGFAEDGVALKFFAGAGVDAAGGVELLPVDGEALGDPDVTVDGEGGAGVADGVAAGVGGEEEGALEGRADADGRGEVGLGGGSGGGDLLLAGRSGGDVGGDAVSELGGRFGAGCEGDVEEEKGLGAFG
jgi:hypothetical protein